MAQAKTDPTAEDHTKKGFAKNASDKTKEALESAQTSMRETADSVRENTQMAVDDGRLYAAVAHSDFADAVRRHPTTAVLGALGIGIVLGLTLKNNGR